MLSVALCLVASTVYLWSYHYVSAKFSHTLEGFESLRTSHGGDFGGDPSVSKSNRLHVDILRFFFIKLGYVFIDSSKMIGNFPAVLNFDWLFLKVNWFICN